MQHTTAYPLPELQRDLLQLLDFNKIESCETLQSLWSGYGTIYRVRISGNPHKSVIVKHICPPKSALHPRGWHSDIGHQRKLKSYEVEAHWYQHYSSLSNTRCRIPRCLGYQQSEASSLLVLEDLDSVAFDLRRAHLHKSEIKACLSWLAAFHARFMGHKGHGLWEIGTYWQLDTRPDELSAMANSPLKTKAREIHERLNACRFQTLVHGDAKYANFCFANDGRVAAVDFQYVGKGCGMKDVAYLLSCIEQGIPNESQEHEFLDHYFSVLRQALNELRVDLSFSALEDEWRSLYPFAWADFERFLKGWAPDHWKSTRYAQLQVQKVLDTFE